ncbi:pimeloyl-ACP methyl ester esterase BioH [Dyella sp. A6]|uniref:pimeloyl-ACP methyl ester esterase BioH n=1 Tax=Dyella aluminiiresistens TaxID=3069105 RepID=UPI002E7747E2|nr:pimeloyl-ACP methyl ester esterase BioH [Dyella sp. A6]
MNLFIERTGDGPVPLVLIHGWAMHGGMFAPLVDALQSQCTMYVVDLPGHGYSRDCMLPLDPRACADAIAAKVPPALWLGWSLGGLMALAAALERPQQVLGLAMLCATPRFVRGSDWPQGNDASLVQQLAADLETDYHATLERFMALEAMGSADPRAELRRLREEAFARGEPKLRVLQEGIRVLESTDLRDRLPQLTVPSAWIAGRRDRLVHPAAMAWSASAANGRFTEIAHAGHAPFFGHADAVTDALQPLLANATAPVSP